MNHNRFDISCFRYMGAEERDIIKQWLYYEKSQNYNHTQNQKIFIERVEMALSKVWYDFFIADVAPSLNENGDIFYRRGSKIVTDINCIEWNNAANRFFENEEWYSELANLYEGDLLKAYKLATSYWTLANISEKRILEQPINEIFKLYDGYAIVKNSYDGSGRQFISTFDYLSFNLSEISVQGQGIVILKRKF